MTRAQLVVILILTKYIAMTFSSSLTCPLPLQAKSGEQSSVHVTVYFCYQTYNAAETICEVKIAQNTLRKGLVTNLDYDINEYALLAKFYGREICTSYRKMILSKTPGTPVENSTSCDMDCFTGNKMVDIEDDYVCDGNKCGDGVQKLNFIVTSGSRKFRHYGPTNCLIIALVFVFWL
jgi:hypothetical protein